MTTRLTFLRAAALGLSVSFIGPVLAQETLTYRYFLDRLTDLAGLPYLEPGVKCAQASSYDRASHDPAHWGANADSGKYIRIEPNGEAVMVELEGPGCIFRIWSANPQGKIRFYLDGDAEPTYEFDFHRLFRGEFGPQKVPRPIVYKRDPNNPRSASDCYLPIPFARSCKVTADKPHGQYYHIGYKLYPPGTKVETFHLPLSEEDNRRLQEVALVWSRRGQNPVSPSPQAQTRRREFHLAPGQEATVVDLRGPARIAALKAKLTSTERYALRKVMLRGYWDEEENPSLNAPLGDFFGAAWEETYYRALPLGITKEGYYCYFRMPFARRGVLKVENQGRRPADLWFEVTYEPLAELPPYTGYFHAKWRREAPCKVFDYPFLEAQGRGKFVGVMLFIEHPIPGWWGEGDEKVWVDGEDFPSIFGTGSEDYFGDAWGIRSDLREPLFGDNYEKRSRSCCYRFHIPDSIPFSKSFRMTIENYDPGFDDYATVAYWYALPGSTDFFREVPVAERVPWSRAVPNMVEAEELFAEQLPAGAQIVEDFDREAELSGGRGLDLGLRRPGERMGPARLPVEEEGVYLLVIWGEPGKPLTGLTVALDGRPLRLQSVEEEKGIVFFGPKRLAAGEHQLELGFVEPTAGVLDGFTLRWTRSEGTIEAEAAEVVEVKGPKPGVQQMTYRPPLSGRGAQLFFTPKKVGSYLVLAFEVPRDGRYCVAAYASTSWDYGIYRITVDGQPLAEPADLYSPRWIVAGKEIVGVLDLKAGRHLIKFEAVGKNEASRGYFLGLDAISIDPAK